MFLSHLQAPLAIANVETSLLVLAISVAVGGLAIHIGSMLAVTSRSYVHAILTAGVGGIAWMLVGMLFAAIGAFQSLASIVGLVVWIAVIGRSYGVGWLRAGLLGLFAWVAALVVLALLSALGVDALHAYGVPGT